MVYKSRKEWVDALRALAMLIVMVWHFSNNLPGQWIYNVFTAPIMIPLFFAITGYVFNGCEGNSNLFYKKLFKHLILPWLALAIIKGAVIGIIRGSTSYYGEFLINLFTGENLWYFPCCIIAEILFFITLKYFHSTINKVIISTLLCITGFMLSRFEIFDNLNISTAFICQAYIVMGYGFKLMGQKTKFGKTTPFLGYICFICFIIGSGLVAFCPPPIGTSYEISMDVHRNYYFNFFIIALLILFGNIALFYLANRINRFPKLLTFIGRNTIVFYIFHYDTIMPLSILTSYCGIEIDTIWTGVLIKIVWSIIICSLLSMALNKWAPLLVGRVKTSLIEPKNS